MAKHTELAAAALALATVTIVAGTASGDEVRVGAARSPVTWYETEELDGATRAMLQPVAACLLGVEPSEIRGGRGELTDEHSFGRPNATQVLVRLTVPGIELRHERTHETATVEISLVLDPTDSTLVMAYTASRSEWVLPQRDEWARDPEAELSSVDTIREVAPITGTDELQSSIVEVLEKVWAVRAINPSRMGQVILRPRSVTTTYPPIYHEDGTDEPNLHVALYWVLEAMGAMMPGAHYPPGTQPEYMSTAIEFLDDSNLGTVQGYYCP
jgi:hypothetical protein